MAEHTPDDILQKRARPSGGMCCACIHRHSSCGWLDFGAWLGRQANKALEAEREALRAMERGEVE